MVEGQFDKKTWQSLVQENSLSFKDKLNDFTFKTIYNII
jgi:hypothetical protein